MMQKSKLIRTVIQLFIAAAILLPLFVLVQPGLAALGRVENMSPAGGSTTTITSGDDFTVYVQVYKAGVTDAPGQGADITCTLHWGTVPFFWDPWTDTTDTPMIYNTDIENNDEYMATITPGVGLYEFTTYCTDTIDDSTLWQNAGNGRFVVDAVSGSCNSASQGDGNVYGVGLGHNSFASQYRQPFGAVPTNQATVSISFRSCMDDLDSLPQMRVYNDRANTESWVYLQFDGHEADPALGGVTYWRGDVTIPTTPTILYYIFRAQDDVTYLFYRDDDPQFYGGGWGQAENDQNTAQNNSYQLTVYDENFVTASWLRSAVVYQIFPERFRNGDVDNDPVQGGDWIYGDTVRKLAWTEDICNPRDPGAGCVDEYGNQFFGGDLQGVIDELDYLQELGVTTLYLNPIFQAPSNHLYDTSNFDVIDPYFGDLSTFQTLTAEAEERGIHIILDGVFNHTSSDSLYFDRYAKWDDNGNATTSGVNDESGACESTDSLYRDWFYIPDSLGSPGSDALDRCNNTNNTTYTPGSGTWDQDYTAWWGYGSLPKLQSNEEPVRDYFYSGDSGAVGPYWIGQGADGWRFDVGDDVDLGSGSGDSNGYWAGFRGAIHTVDADSVMLGELWGDASSWLVGNQWDSVMNYRFRSSVLSWMFDSCISSSDGCDATGTVFEDNDSNAGSSSGAISGLSIDDFDNRLKSIQEDYPKTAWQAMMNLMGSHDTNRVLFLLKKISNDNAATALSKFKFLTIFQFTYPGAPTVYYGDEAALAPDGYWTTKWEDDPYNRAPFPWADEGRTPDTNMQEHARKLAVLRSQYPVLRTGDLAESTRHNINRTYAYARVNGTNDLAVVMLNRNTSATQNITMSGLDSSFNGTQLIDMLNCGGTPITCPTYTVSGGSVVVNNVSPLWGAILVEGPLPAYDLSLALGSHDLPHSGSTSLTATVTNIGGEVVADGTQVNFSQLSGSGSLSSATAATSNGQASVTFNAPASTILAVFQASAGNYVGARDVGSAFVGALADIADMETAATGIGPETVELPGLLSVEKIGNGEPVVTLTEFDNVPNASNDASSYVDIHLPDATDVTGLTVMLTYTDETDEANHTLYWKNGADWVQVSPTGEVVVDTDANTVQFTFTAATVPSLSQLTGTPFVVGDSGAAPTAVTVAQFTAQAGVQTWLIASAAAMLLIVVSGTLAVCRRRLSKR